MSAYEIIITKLVKRLREEYNLGKYCGRSLFSIVEQVKLDSNNSINLFRLPFEENNISGFVGYKNNQFVVFTNTNKNLGYEIFTLAHELYHLLENQALVKSEGALDESEENRNGSDDIADMFAAELLMPKDIFTDDFTKIMADNNLKNPDHKLIIQMQQDYHVEYRAVTKRLRELKLIDENVGLLLDKILENQKEFLIATKKLGYSNELNEPSRAIYLPKRFLRAIDENYKNHQITYDDLTVIFRYCNLTPEDFGYEGLG